MILQLMSIFLSFVLKQKKETKKNSRLILLPLIFKKSFSSQNPSRSLGVWVPRRHSWVPTHKARARMIFENTTETKIGQYYIPLNK